jgi:hypothetical protein
MDATEPAELVSRPLAIGLGLVAFALSAMAALLFAGLIVLGLTSGHLWTDKIAQLIFPFILALKAIAVLNIANSVKFMSQRSWAPFVRFLWLSLLAMVVVVMIGMSTFV